MSGPALHPAYPERVCWGCDQYCPATNLTYDKDAARTPHPLELFGDDWHDEAELVPDSGEVIHLRVAGSTARE